MSLRLALGCQILLSLLICAAGGANAQKPPQSQHRSSRCKAREWLFRVIWLSRLTGPRLPAVLLVPAISGLKGSVLETARDLATHGFVALAVDYDPEHVSQESDLVQGVADEQLSLRLSAGADWLARQRPLVDPQRIGAIGWDGGSARILKLAQQGQIHAGVMIENGQCAVPDNLPAAPAVPMLLVIGGCTPERGRELQAGIGGAYRVEAAPAWGEIHKFLSQAAGTGNASGIFKSGRNDSRHHARDQLRRWREREAGGAAGGFARLRRAMGSGAIARGCAG